MNLGFNSNSAELTPRVTQSGKSQPEAAVLEDKVHEDWRQKTSRIVISLDHILSSSPALELIT